MLQNIKLGLKKAKTLDIIALWYGMVWYGMVWYGMAVAVAISAFEYFLYRSKGNRFLFTGIYLI